MSLLQVIEAGFGYEKQEIFRKLNFQVKKGEVFCLLGPNGCGKTTLLDCILGVRQLNAGKILLNGQDLNTFRSGQIARYIAYVPQSHERTFPYTVMDIVKMGRAAYTGRFSAPSKLDKAIAREALEMVGLFHLRHRPYTQLSGGEAQLVMVARALAQKTPMIIMDEPTAHLDFKHELEVLETIVELVGDSQISVIMATHFPNHAFYFENKKLPTRVALMHDHNFLELGRPSEVIAEESMKTLYGVNTRLISCATGERSELKQLVPISTIS